VALTVTPNPTWADFAPQMTRIALPSTPMALGTRAPTATSTPTATREPSPFERLSDWVDRTISPLAIAFSVVLVVLLVILIVLWLTSH
jgi:hypothetical protein